MSSFLNTEKKSTGKYHTPMSLFAKKSVMNLFPKATCKCCSVQDLATTHVPIPSFSST